MTSVPSKPSGIDLQWVDESVRPQDDLFRHVNGKWLDTFEIPEDRASHGAFHALHDTAQENVRTIIEEASAIDSPEAKLIANLYGSFMDEELAEKLGTSPVRPLLDAIDAAQDLGDLANVLGKLQRQGRASLFGIFVSPDSKNSERNLLYINQGGLGLPDESYYSQEDHAAVREAYVAHLERLAGLFVLDNPAGIAQSVMDLETAIAAVSWDRVTNRDVEKTYTLMTQPSLEEFAPSFDWKSWFAGLQTPDGSTDELVVRQPAFVEGVATLWAERPIEQWKDWLTIRTISGCAAYLNDAVVQERFDFYGRTLSGTPKLIDRWRRGVSLVEGVVGDAIGKIYVERHFPPEARQHVQALVDNLIEAYRVSIETLDWMGPATRERALAKLAKFDPKIGHPEKWKDYSALDFDASDLLGNVLRAGEWETDYELNKIGKPVDRTEWFINPQTVNAYYNSKRNEIVFPAAILQPPFFDMDRDDAANYGGIGAVIGHEIGHGFDDQGSRSDGDGNLTDWWDAQDRAEFEKRAKALIEQYDNLRTYTAPEHKVNGALTVGENIGDIGGLAIALKAYEISLGGEEAPVIDGLTGTQRVFFGWAQVWRTKIRKEEAIRYLSVDPHSPTDLRCNAVASNIDAFYDAFDVESGDSLYLDPDSRVHIW